MRSIVTATIAAIEAVAVALAGLLVVAVPAVLLWAVTFRLSAEPSAVAAAVGGSGSSRTACRSPSRSAPRRCSAGASPPRR
ncbi:hypothetical protein MUN77_04895 [Leucobacter allii]|uniref:hypothetical protein n=1 Tax=Leucobacter allii TaxID=2932247 RepID=UPI001FD39E13|nr:hypothetical protein [Leucobacter allii]UOR02650.1 hypothetical protein MUN77_04895 [Leucobacter allii]